jgi:hypothetical protein
MDPLYHNSPKLDQDYCDYSIEYFHSFLSPHSGLIDAATGGSEAFVVWNQHFRKREKRSLSPHSI